MNSLVPFESLLKCDTLEELRITVSHIVNEMGFEHFIYGVQVNTSLTNPYRFILSGYPKEWRSHYIEADYEKIDPTFLHCIKSGSVIPVLWDGKLSSNRKAARLMGEASEFGLASGVSLAVHGGHGETAMLSLACSRKPKSAYTDIIASLGNAQLFACYLHEAIQRLVLNRESLPIKTTELTPRENECLLWAAEGKSSKEIADILHVSQRTVIFHVHNASHKMGVSHRQHAIARAISLGLIHP
ncbi:MAG: LuxR family transcriptional regulator [Gammaproteobacteria bacterium]|nr:LuxR family transcriptional regulator [Gammaproteobacteria bacterium]